MAQGMVEGVDLVQTDRHLGGRSAVRSSSQNGEVYLCRSKPDVRRSPCRRSISNRRVRGVITVADRHFETARSGSVIVVVCLARPTTSS